jgi:GNAT superfamily N-acetyltransferase
MLTIYPASAADYPTIQQIAHTTWPTTFGEILSPVQIEYMLDWMYSLPALQEQVEKKGHRFLLAKEKKEGLGFLSYQLFYQGNPVTKIHKIYVLPTTQGKGVGKHLLELTSEIALEAKNTTLTLNVNRYNKAIEFYKKIGFEIIGQENIDVGQGFLMEDYIL